LDFSIFLLLLRRLEVLLFLRLEVLEVRSLPSKGFILRLFEILVSSWVIFTLILRAKVAIHVAFASSGLCGGLSVLPGDLMIAFALNIGSWLPRNFIL
jgi:hypothetical protein